METVKPTYPTLRLGDRERDVRFTIREACQLERETKTSCLTVVGKILELAVHETVTTLWIALRATDPALTLAQTEALVQSFLDAGGRWADLVQPLVEAIQRSRLFGAAPAPPSGVLVDVPVLVGSGAP